jgi:hypothetical protein
MYIMSGNDAWESQIRTYQQVSVRNALPSRFSVGREASQGEQRVQSTYVICFSVRIDRRFEHLIRGCRKVHSLLFVGRRPWPTLVMLEPRPAVPPALVSWSVL